MSERGQSANTWGFVEGTSIADGRTILRPLGGEDLEVFLVREARLNQDMVAKVLRPNDLVHPKQRRKLEREAWALGELSHRCIVRGSGTVFDGPYPHLLLEYVPGPTLEQQLRRTRPLAWPLVLGLARDLAGALEHLADRGLVHRDVRPRNIILGGPPRLIDLGSVVTAEEAGRLPPTRNTGNYKAPERVIGGLVPGPVGPAYDVWGLGVTLYYAVSGQRPFPRKHNARWDADLRVRCPQLVRDPEPLPPQIPRPLAELLMATLERQPDQRPTASALVRALDALDIGPASPGGLGPPDAPSPGV